MERKYFKRTIDDISFQGHKLHQLRLRFKERCAFGKEYQINLIPAQQFDVDAFNRLKQFFKKKIRKKY